MGICLIWLKMFLLLNCISNCSSRHGFRLKAWNQSRKFDKFCLFSPVREKCIVKRNIRIWLLLQSMAKEKCLGEKVYFIALWQLPVCLLVCFIFFWNWMNISLKISLLFWKVLNTVLPFLELFIISDCTFLAYLLNVYTLCILCIKGIALSLQLY